MSRSAFLARVILWHGIFTLLVAIGTVVVLAAIVFHGWDPMSTDHSREFLALMSVSLFVNAAFLVWSMKRLWTSRRDSDEQEHG